MVEPSSSTSPFSFASRSMETKSPSCGRALDGGQHGEALAHDVDLLVDVLVGDLDVLDGHGEVLQRRELDLRGDVDLGGEGQGVVVVEAGHLDVGLAQDAHLVLADDLGVDLRDRVLDDLLQDDGAPDALVEHAVGHLAGTEAGHADLLAELLVDLTEGVVQVPPGHLDRHPDPRGAEFLDGALHSGSAPWIADRRAPTGVDDAELPTSLETAWNGRVAGCAAHSAHGRGDRI